MTRYGPIAPSYRPRSDAIAPSRDTTVERPRRDRAGRTLWTLRVLFDGARVCREGPRPLAPGRLVLGRPTLEAWGLGPDPLLSREHLALELRGDRLTATDLDSRNGSACGGVPLPAGGSRVLESGDVLRLGDTFALVRRVPVDLRPVPPRGALAGLRGDAPVLHALRGEARRVGPRPNTVLLLGESGVGKGVMAEALHALSGRPGPLVRVNCAAIPAHLAESILFGHVRGAFTGADKAAPGLFRAADGGTLFLDEVADLPLALQPKLLHAVEAGEVTPVGAARPVPVDLRILGATSLDVDAAVAAGRFRGELLARLGEYRLPLPPLRDRVEDVLPLFADVVDRPLHPDLVARLLHHPWPFNVRELLAVASEVSVRGEDQAELGPELVAGRLGPATPAPAPASAQGGPPDRAAVEAALRAARGQVSEAARALGRSRRQLYRDLARLGVEVEPFRGG